MPESTHPQGRQPGPDTQLLEGFLDAVRSDPRAGQVRARLRHRWDGGFSVDGQVESVSDADGTVRRTHRLRTDWPPPFGADSGPTPGAESVLAAVGACVATTWVMKAALRGVAVDELEVVTEGQVDLRGLLELDESVTPRFTRIDVTVAVRSEADDATLDELGRTVSRTSPAYDAAANPVPVSLCVDRLPGS